MIAHSHPDQEKVKMTFECTPDERAYIKMLAAKAHVTLSDLVLSYLSKDFPSKGRRRRNKETLAAIKELDEGGGTEYTSIDDFWDDMGIRPHAKS